MARQLGRVFLLRLRDERESLRDADRLLGALHRACVLDSTGIAIRGEDQGLVAIRLGRDLLERVADDLRAMIDRQENVIEETERLDAERRRRGNRSRAQLKSLRDLA